MDEFNDEEYEVVYSPMTIPVNGKIVNIIENYDYKIEGKNTFSLEIEYEYDEDVYRFQVDGFLTDVTGVINEKKITSVPVYIQITDPSLASVDEEMLKRELNN